MPDITPKPVEPTFLQLKEVPRDTDANSSSYVITYRTKKHDSGNGSSQVALDYGPNMATNNYSREQLEQSSFTENHGDNLQWDTMFWKFSVEGTPVLVEIAMNSLSRGMAGSGVKVIHPNKTIRLPQEENAPAQVLGTDILQSFGSFPFDEKGTMRAPNELARHGGKVSFVDSSSGSGESKLLDGIRARLKGNMDFRELASMGEGPEFVHSNQYRYFNGHDLAKLDGTPDAISTKIIKGIISAPAKPGAASPTGTPDSVFKPRENTKPDLTNLPSGPADTSGVKKYDEKQASGMFGVADKKTNPLSNLDPDKITKVNKALKDTKAIMESFAGSENESTNPDSKKRVVLGYTKLRCEKLK